MTESRDMNTNPTTAVTFTAEGFAPADDADAERDELFAAAESFGIDLSGATPELRADTGRVTMLPGVGSTVLD